MPFKHGLCHFYSEFKYLFCDMQGLLAKNVGGSDQQPRGTSYQQSTVDDATKRKACPA